MNTFTKKSLREFIADALAGTKPTQSTSGPHDDNSPVNVSDIVDVSKSVTDPSGDEHKPNSKKELQVTVNTLLDGTSDDDASSTYDTIKTAIDKDKEDKMKKSSVEEVIRQHIRTALNEMYDDDEDNDGAKFADIAKEIGMSVAGAKQAVDKAVVKLKFLKDMDPDDLSVFVLETVKDYIDYLKGSGELTDEDVALLKAHPSTIEELPDFKEFLDDAIKADPDYKEFFPGAYDTVRRHKPRKAAPVVSDEDADLDESDESSKELAPKIAQGQLDKERDVTKRNLIAKREQSKKDAGFEDTMSAIRSANKHIRNESKICYGFDNDGEGNCVGCGHDEDSELHRGVPAKPLNHKRIENAERDAYIRKQRQLKKRS